MVTSIRISVSRVTSQSRWLLGVITLVLGGIFVGLASLRSITSGLALILLVLILGVFLWSIARRDYFNIFSWVCLGYLGFALGGLYYAISGVLYQYGYYIYVNGSIQDLGLIVYASLPENQEYLALALIVATIGWVSFGVGYFVLTPYRARPKSLPNSSFSCLRRRLFTTVVIMSLVGLGFAYLFFESSGGFLYLITHIYGRTVFRSSAYLGWGALLLPVANLLWFSYDYSRARKNLLYWLHTFLTSVILISFGDRWGIVGFWLMLTLVHYYLSRRQVKLKLVLFLGIAVLVISLLVSIWRNFSIVGNDPELGNMGQVAVDTLRTMLGDRNLTDIDVLTWIIGRGENEIGLLAGRSFLQVAYAPIPRSLFPSKPDDLGQIIFRAYTGTDIFNSWHASFVGELYLNFLLPGVILGMFLLGLISSWVEWQKWHSSHPGIVLMYSVFAVKFVVLLITVDFLMSFLQATFYAIPIAIMSFYISGAKLRFKS